MDEGGEYAICRWTVAEGGEIQRRSGVAQSEPEGGGTGGIAIDRRYMLPDRPIGKGGADMSAMRPMQG